MLFKQKRKSSRHPIYLGFWHLAPPYLNRGTMNAEYFSQPAFVTRRQYGVLGFYDWINNWSIHMCNKLITPDSIVKHNKQFLYYSVRMTLQHRINELIDDYKAHKDHKFNKRQLSILLGVTRATVTDWCNGKTKKIDGDNAQKVAAFFHVESAWVQNGSPPKYKKVSEPLQTYFDNKHYPRVIGTARCGSDGYYMDLEGGDGFIEFETRRGAVAIRIKGHSMHPAIKEGWFVVIEPDCQAEPGEYVLVKFKDGKKMIKELMQIKPDGYLLLSVNGNERITALHDDLESDIQPIAAIVPPRKHREF